MSRPFTAPEWVAGRLPTAVTHLDVAACGLPSAGVLDAEIAHLRAEVARGGYVAEDEAGTLLDAGRARLGELVGVTGADVAYTDGAGTAFQALLAAWPSSKRVRIGTVPGEYGGNALVLQRLAAERGWSLVRLPVDGLGRVTDLPAGLDLVTFPQVASQRGIAQPVSEVLRSGVPLILDVAQSLGQTTVTTGCAAYVGTSRKWLCGPRGVGFLACSGLELTAPPTLHDGRDLRRFDTQEAHVAGRVALAIAAAQWTPALLPVVHARASAARTVLREGRTGWRVIEPVDEPTGITTLVGGDPVRARAALLARGLLTSAVPVSRAADLTAPVLRISTAAWVTDDDLAALVVALRESDA